MSLVPTVFWPPGMTYSFFSCRPYRCPAQRSCQRSQPRHHTTCSPLRRQRRPHSSWNLGRAMGVWVCQQICIIHSCGDGYSFRRYRNFLMACATLMNQRQQLGYFSLLDSPIPPSVRNLQTWIESAWEEGFISPCSLSTFVLREHRRLWSRREKRTKRTNRNKEMDRHGRCVINLHMTTRILKSFQLSDIWVAFVSRSIPWISVQSVIATTTVLNICRYCRAQLVDFDLRNKSEGMWSEQVN